ncbi:MAG: hypothetical protein V3W11_09280 [bacterium]
MKTRTIHFFDIPIYRCSEDVFRAEYETSKNNYIDSVTDSVENLDPSLIEYVARRFEMREWYPWQYNDIIGWLDLYAYIDEKRVRIGAFISFVDNLKIRRTNRRRIFKLSGIRKDGSKKFRSPVVFEVELTEPYSNKKIFEAVAAELEKLKVRKELRSRYVELDKFLKIGRFVDWVSFFDLLEASH